MLATGPIDGNPIVMAEGHARMTAYVMESGAEGLEVIHATAPLGDLERWRYFPDVLRRT
jgi:hypothetical protein